MVAYVTELNDANFGEFTGTLNESNAEGKVALVDIWAPWCGPCRQISPIVDKISSEYYGKITVGKLEADSNRETVSTLGVRNIPTLLVYKDGEVVEKLVGAVTEDKIKEAIDKHI